MTTSCNPCIQDGSDGESKTNYKDEGVKGATHNDQDYGTLRIHSLPQYFHGLLAFTGTSN